jgi:hypothetical protein
MINTGVLFGSKTAGVFIGKFTCKPKKKSVAYGIYQFENNRKSMNGLAKSQSAIHVDTLG